MYGHTFLYGGGGAADNLGHFQSWHGKEKMEIRGMEEMEEFFVHRNEAHPVVGKNGKLPSLVDWKKIPIKIFGLACVGSEILSGLCVEKRCPGRIYFFHSPWSAMDRPGIFRARGKKWTFFFHIHGRLDPTKP